MSGPLAFPTDIRLNPADPGGNGGMTLRDWFAGQALAATVHMAGTDQRLTGMADPVIAGWAAVVAYSVADAMLSARQTGGEA